MTLFSGNFGRVFGNTGLSSGKDANAASGSRDDAAAPSESLNDKKGHEVEADRRGTPWMEPLAPSIFDTAALKALYMTRPMNYAALSPVDDLKALIKRAIDERALPLTMFMLVLKLYAVFSGDREFYQSTLQDYAHRWGTMDRFFAMEEYGAFYVKFAGCSFDEVNAAMEYIKEKRAAAANTPPAEFLEMLDTDHQPGTDKGEGIPS